ncbi:MAG: hypothetical protein IIC67_00190 [Thaumarchaeota archaeon]|nr:hypothetical protein [Nitrososphaerota archaeon]
MWYIGQTVLRIADNTPVIYLGVELYYKNDTKTKTLFKEINGREYYEDGGVPVWYKTKYTEIRDSAGNIVFGDQALAIFI